MQTKRLIIRPVKMSDLDQMYAYTSDEENMKYERDVFTYDGLKNMLSRYIEDEIFFSCIEKQSEKMIGHFYLGKTNPSDFNEYSLGYIFHPDVQGQGYCTEGAKALMDYAFHELGAHRVQARCNPENVASYRVMEKVGFKKEGLLRKRCAFKKDAKGNPIYTDELVYGLLKEDLQK
jgi:RimJ/RimL family protein N-acetyltransferase